MIDQDLIINLRTKYGEIYLITLGNTEYVVKALTLKEINTIDLIAEDSSADAEDYAVTSALVYPVIESLDDIPAGIISTLANEVRTISGFGTAKAVKQLLDFKRQEMSSIRGLMKAFILATMPAYTVEDLDKFTFSELVSKVALAEQIIQVKQAIYPAATGEGGEVTLQVVDPEEEAIKETKAREKEQRKYERLAKKGNAIPVSDEVGPAITPKIKRDDPIAEKLRQAMG